MGYCSVDIIYGPFGSDTELSGLPDCSETLRADWREAHPSAGDRLEELEELLLGGEAV